MAATGISNKQQSELIAVLKDRFEKHKERHTGIGWADVQARLEAKRDALRSLSEMEATGGEPDVITFDKKTGEYTFCDCSPESPSGRRNICYDPKGYAKRLKEKLPIAGNVLDMAAAMGVEVMDESQYLDLQKLGEFDAKTQSWLKAPADVVALGGGIFGDRRYGRVFVYHNGPQSFYAGRAFRGILKV